LRSRKGNATRTAHGIPWCPARQLLSCALTDCDRVSREKKFVKILLPKSFSNIIVDPSHSVVTTRPEIGSGDLPKIKRSTTRRSRHRAFHTFYN
jgi:hypothetical protein